MNDPECVPYTLAMGEDNGDGSGIRCVWASPCLRPELAEALRTAGHEDIDSGHPLGSSRFSMRCGVVDCGGKSSAIGFDRLPPISGEDLLRYTGAIITANGGEIVFETVLSHVPATQGSKVSDPAEFFKPGPSMKSILENLSREPR